MKKFVIAALTAASILASSSAFAGWYDGFGYYNPSCGWVATVYGPQVFCD